jgi:DNA-binding NarL/FixJ family response regulator
LPLEESGGSHSFANIWGLLRFNAALNLNALIDKKTISRTSELYFKYLTTLLEIKEQSKYESLILNGKDKKILLIDDQAKDGWEEVLKSFFRDSKFEVATNYVDGLELAKDLKWDLILLDLRLDPANEDIDGELINPEDFSGAKLLREIKEFNPGLQVIMLTASNKSWNLKKLLELGANGYYLKESPEFNFSNEQAMENIKNFKSEIEKCFEMVWLKNIFSKLETLEKSDFINNLEDSFKDILYNYLSTSKDLLLLSSRNKEFINKAYLQLFFIIEEFVKLDNIFKENDFKELGKEWYVIIDDNEILVRKSKIYESGIKIESAIQMNSKYVLKAHSYIVKKDPRLDVNYKISSLLIFRYGKSNSSVKNWTNIYTKRNADGVAHSNPEETVSSIDILLLIEFIDYLFNTKIDPTNKEKGLKQKSLNEKAKELLDKFKK